VITLLQLINALRNTGGFRMVEVSYEAGVGAYWLVLVGAASAVGSLVILWVMERG
jgi:hypothetical protein